MKKYFVKYTHDFGNCYSLYYAETEEQLRMAEEMDCLRITRSEAETMCAAENARRKHNPNFAYYADSIIYPIDFDMDKEDPFTALRIEKYLAVRV